MPHYEYTTITYVIVFISLDWKHNGGRRQLSDRPNLFDEARMFVCANENEYCFCDGHVQHSQHLEKSEQDQWEAVRGAVRCRGSRCFCAGDGKPRQGSNSVDQSRNAALTENGELVVNKCSAEILAKEETLANNLLKPSSEESNQISIVQIIVIISFVLVIFGVCIFKTVQRRKLEMETVTTGYGRFQDSLV